MNDLKKISLYPKINIYKNLIPHAKEFVELLKYSEESNEPKTYFEEWDKWYVFGRYMKVPLSKKVTKQPVTEYEKKQIQFGEEISNAFFTAVEDYIKENNIQEPGKWDYMGLSVCKYNPNIDDGRTLAMHYHTDYVAGRSQEPGFKFVITCTIYLNDEYEGGGISFLVDESGDNTGNVISYKPVAGDVLVFPSGVPGGELYYHGVEKITSGYKYFVRCFYGYNYEGSEEWHKNKEFYGEEIWKEMEEERYKKELNAGMWHRHVIEPGQPEIKMDGSTAFYKKAEK